MTTDYSERRRWLRLLHGKKYKQGCTGKTYHSTIEAARSVVYRLYRKNPEGKHAQVYKCCFCPGWHVTGSKIKAGMNCPALKPKGIHVWTLRKFPTKIGRELLASCKFCGVRLSSWFELTPENKNVLMGIRFDTRLTLFKRAAIASWLKYWHERVVLSKWQAELVNHLIKWRQEQTA